MSFDITWPQWISHCLMSLPKPLPNISADLYIRTRHLKRYGSRLVVLYFCVIVLGCILCSQFIIDNQPQSLQWCVQCHVISDRVIATLDCTYPYSSGLLHWHPGNRMFVPIYGFTNARKVTRDDMARNICCLTHIGRVTHIGVSKLSIIGSDNGLSPGRHQAIIWTNAAILFIWPPGTTINEILIEMHILSFKTMNLGESSTKRRPFCLGLNVLTATVYNKRGLYS